MVSRIRVSVRDRGVNLAGILGMQVRPRKA